MPEALAVIFVLGVCVAVWAMSWFHVRRTPVDPAAELVRLDERLGWLEERRRHAEATNWDADMLNRLIGQIDETRKQQAAYAAALDRQN